MRTLEFKLVTEEKGLEILNKAYNEDNQANFVDRFNVTGGVLTAAMKKAEQGDFVSPRFDVIVSSDYYYESSLKELFEEFL